MKSFIRELKEKGLNLSSSKFIDLQIFSGRFLIKRDYLCIERNVETCNLLSVFNLFVRICAFYVHVSDPWSTCFEKFTYIIESASTFFSAILWVIFLKVEQKNCIITIKMHIGSYFTMMRQKRQRSAKLLKSKEWRTNLESR